jgi:hypothetical protein
VAERAGRRFSKPLSQSGGRFLAFGEVSFGKSYEKLNEEVAFLWEFVVKYPLISIC